MVLGCANKKMEAWFIQTGFYLVFAYTQSRFRERFANFNSQHFCRSFKKLHLLLSSVNNYRLDVADKQKIKLDRSEWLYFFHLGKGKELLLNEVAYVKDRSLTFRSIRRKSPRQQIDNWIIKMTFFPEICTMTWYSSIKQEG